MITHFEHVRDEILMDSRVKCIPNTELVATRAVLVTPNQRIKDESKDVFIGDVYVQVVPNVEKFEEIIENQVLALMPEIIIVDMALHNSRETQLYMSRLRNRGYLVFLTTISEHLWYASPEERQETIKRRGYITRPHPFRDNYTIPSNLDRIGSFLRDYNGVDDNGNQRKSLPTSIGVLGGGVTLFLTDDPILRQDVKDQFGGIILPIKLEESEEELFFQYIMRSRPNIILIDKYAPVANGVVQVAYSLGHEVEFI